MQQDEVIMSKLLALKANQDPENGVNKKGIAELHQASGSSGNNWGVVQNLIYILIRLTILAMKYLSKGYIFILKVQLVSHPLDLSRTVPFSHQHQ